mmetsp:Transcript_33897/g.81114  ORF Transcript_33897/g.81114 Transcript_33897/m.81114 type:complete len:370 (-) Transcript_33897:44-1153(-)
MSRARSHIITSAASAACAGTKRSGVDRFRFVPEFANKNTSSSASTAHRKSWPWPEKRSATATRGLSSTAKFDALPNNVYHGVPVYANVDLSSNLPDASIIRNADADAVFVIAAASRSMGLEFAKQLIDRTKGRIACCVRDPGSSPALDEYLGTLAPGQRERVQVFKLDVTELGDIEQLEKDLSSSYGRVDALFNVAGVLGDKKTTPGPEMKLNQLDKHFLEEQMSVNCIGPMMLTKTLAPLLAARKGKSKYLRSARESIVVNLSARVASLADNQGPLAWYSYRMSKAALNQGVRTSAHELRRQGTWTVALYPGMTDTDMSKPFQTKAMVEKGMVFPVDFTVGRLLDIVDRMEEKNSGGLYDWAGQAIPF